MAMAVLPGDPTWRCGWLWSKELSLVWSPASCCERSVLSEAHRGNSYGLQALQVFGHALQSPAAGLPGLGSDPLESWRGALSFWEGMRRLFLKLSITLHLLLGGCSSAKPMVHPCGGLKHTEGKFSATWFSASVGLTVELDHLDSISS